MSKDEDRLQSLSILADTHQYSLRCMPELQQYTFMICNKQKQTEEKDPMGKEIKSK